MNFDKFAHATACYALFLAYEFEDANQQCGGTKAAKRLFILTNNLKQRFESGEQTNAIYRSMRKKYARYKLRIE